MILIEETKFKFREIEFPQLSAIDNNDGKNEKLAMANVLHNKNWRNVHESGIYQT